ncbi:glycine-rich domain-containing protein [Neokomagataea anthophila]|uniref:Glycine-rich domain-containing protein n=1 Tax=Neokomagataea anthophila TaxID=2826925 RepID=A0ABS5E938_9PROT|nr:hypothetical protein [Neokomagataea anthophila]MBR0560326.1 hypothetical protein [Neokomagataea anthophila]
MDRALVYPGSVPMDTDILRVGRYGKAALGTIADMVFGAGVTAASGLACTPSPDGLFLTIGRGVISASGVMDATNLGGAGAGLPADFSSVTVQYVNASDVNVPVLSTGANFTVYAVCSEQDVDASVLPFYNVDNPLQTQAGPNNTGQALPTRRMAGMSFVVATSMPSAPVGGVVVALYTINVPSGVQNLSALHAVPLEVFWPTIPQMATRNLVADVTQSTQFLIANTSLQVPQWATSVELRVIGGGGGGAASTTTSVNGSLSGSGGGAGGDAWGVYAVDPSNSAPLVVTIGQGGSSGQTGGTTLMTYQGRVLLQANGGQGGSFYSPTGSAGGSGGSASGGTVWNQTGSTGADGQCGALVFAGCGGSGPWGGAGRSGSQGGRPATHYGAGGGGAYSVSTEGLPSLGGAGYQGCVLYRFLP